MAQQHGYSQQSGYTYSDASPPIGWMPPPPGGQQQQQQQPGYAPAPPPIMHAPLSYQSTDQNPSYMEGRKTNMGFDDKSIRAGFIRKVFLLVTMMLTVVLCMVCLAVLHQPTKLFLRQNIALYYLSFVTFLVVYITLMCCENVRRSSPGNLIATAILTLAIGYMTMMISAMYDLTMVLMALGITVFCCTTIIIFATQTKYDLTSCMGFMFIISMVIFFFGLTAIIVMMFTQITILYTIYAGLAALLFMVYLAIDVQMLMGGRKYQLSPEDYIFAAIQLFLDIIYIFWMILQLLGMSNR